MKGLLKMLAAGLLLFMFLAVAQEWEVFAVGLGLRASGSPAPAEPSAQERQAAEATVRQLLTMVRHYYLSAGDPRFTDRMPAAPAVVEEITRDAAYLRKNGRVQDQTLVSLKTTGTATLGDGVVELRVREYWVVRLRFAANGEESDPMRAVVGLARYVLRRTEGSWRVEAWEPLSEAAEDSADGAGPVAAGEAASAAGEVSPTPAGASGSAPASAAPPTGRR